MPKTTNQIEALSQIAQAITSDLYLDDILRLIVTVTAQTLRSKICSLMLLDEKKQELIIRATQSISESYNKKSPLKVGEGIAGKAALEKRPIAVYDVTQEKEYKYKDIAENEGLASLLCVPLMVKGRVIGVINLYTSKPHKFTNNEVHMLTAIANQAAMVIENTELMVKSKIIQEELETRKLVEKAKGILMKEQGLSESDSYRTIQKYSMDSRKSMHQVAEAIVMAQAVKEKR
ncbi:MAG: histidine kinase [Omnitrophica WOR_2 bacterium GWF2_43_52]|nr:MAG: histidine kinase [Omnitrophica WOR_2 bacterium GWA2_44_7]OGX15983.1 MAG: histidine kinase [Omnitrophica WOR_2 bacterium GWC2_44_8]OGX20741.1 MAG: histidine kinase [Omnitrophica WOR_2 bacterium GWF2_43_52]OGX55283.1 MAG: histidine kinase [Omnitrophica WOR_2 bacterium RIFOXYC2_FULL_43_9]HAH19762.1 histidine kinase [Candidatus Omnitrophota bacterium]